jgi:plastocyanin
MARHAAPATEGRVVRQTVLATAGWLLAMAAAASAQRQAGGTLVGTIRASGPVPAPHVIENTTDPHVCGTLHRLDDLVVSPGGGLADAIVAIEELGASGQRPATPGRVVLDNRHCRFVPHVAVITVGSTLEVVNSDPTLHTVHLYGPVEINLALPLQGMRIARRLDRPGLFVVKCDVHGWMQAFVRVDPHPYHAVTDQAGRFQIAGIPPGAYTLGVWHEKLGTRTRRVEIGAGATVQVEVTY